VELGFDVRMLRLMPNFFGGGNLAFIHFGEVSLPDYFYEFKATKKTIKPQFRKSVRNALCVMQSWFAQDYMTLFTPLNFISLPKIETLASLSRFYEAIKL